MSRSKVEYNFKLYFHYPFYCQTDLYLPVED